MRLVRGEAVGVGTDGPVAVRARPGRVRRLELDEADRIVALELGQDLELGEEEAAQARPDLGLA